MLIFAPFTSARLTYIIETLFPGKGTLTTAEWEFKNYRGEKINYSSQKFSSDELHIQPHPFLQERNIQPQEINIFSWEGLPAFFPTEGDLPFDFFAASFFLISRYEEYLPHPTDEYGRYPHTESLAFKNQFLHIPLMDAWHRKIFPTHEIPGFQFIPTYDIDIAYKYLYKSFLKTAASLARDLFMGKWNDCRERINVCLGNKQDPFEQFDHLQHLHDKYDLHPVYFFLLAAKPCPYDKNTSPTVKSFQKIIQTISGKYKTGLHPSWQSGDHPALLREELNQLEEITGQKTFCTRQHYIRMHLPATYRLLIHFGIKEDYSMGYGSINGFRASTSKPFFWYDLEKEEMTSLRIYPFCFMDANVIFEQKLTPAEALAELEFYKKTTMETSGYMLGIWHNHFLTHESNWKAWRNVYEQFLEKLVRKE